MKTIILTFLLSVAAIAAFGQDKMDVVYLKDGRTFSGSIIKPLDGDGVQIMTLGGEVYFFSATEVRRVAREEFRHDNQRNKVFAQKGEGFTNVTTLGRGFGIGSVGSDPVRDNDGRYWALHTVNGFHVTRSISLGVGVGIDWFGDYEMLPVYADLRVYPSLTEWAPFFYGNVGYGLGVLDKDLESGLMAGLGGGLQFSLNPKLALLASVGYRYQGATFLGHVLDAHYLQVSVGVKF
jgi:hypothetical protein